MTHTPQTRAAVRHDLVALAREANRATDGTCLLDGEHRVLTAVRTT